MKKQSWYKAAGAANYPNYVIKLIYAVVAAHFIIVYEEKHTYLDIFTSQNYYSALIINALLAYVLVSLVIRITRFLDYHYPWGRSYRIRMPRQLIGGVLLPVIPAVILATVYFACYEINILDTVYFSRYLQQIILMITVLNGYLFYHWHKLNKQKSIPKGLLENFGDEPVVAPTVADVACIFIENKTCFAYHFDGEIIVWNDTLMKTMSYLPAHQFYMIKRSFIVNRAAIKTISVTTARKTKISLKPPLNLELYISQRENTGFKKWAAKTAN
jgi:hypothetical protein